MNEEPRPRQKPGPKPRGPKTRVNVELPGFLVDALDKAAAEAKASRTRLLEKELAKILGLKKELAEFDAGKEVANVS
jgi:metal-responsive CopG/Arc/MetJ family transcriptional regulator